MIISEVRETVHNIMQSWIESIADEKLRVWCSKNAYMSGGCFASLINDEKVNDYDIFFKKYSKEVEDLKEYYNDFSNNAILLPNKIHLIINKNYMKKPKQMIKEFDFDHTTIYYDYKTLDLRYKTSTFTYIQGKVLILNNASSNLGGTILRMFRLVQNGWSIELIKFKECLCNLLLQDKSINQKFINNLSASWYEEEEEELEEVKPKTTEDLKKENTEDETYID